MDAVLLSKHTVTSGLGTPADAVRARAATAKTRYFMVLRGGSLLECCADVPAEINRFSRRCWVVDRSARRKDLFSCDVAGCDTLNYGRVGDVSFASQERLHAPWSQR